MDSFHAWREGFVVGWIASPGPAQERKEAASFQVVTTEGKAQAGFRIMVPRFEKREEWAACVLLSELRSLDSRGAAVVPT